MPKPPDSPSRTVQRTRAYRGAANDVGRSLRTLRDSRGWTQEQAAEACGMDVRHWQKAEYGQVNLTLATLVRVSSAFEVPVDSVLRWAQTRPAEQEDASCDTPPKKGAVGDAPRGPPPRDEASVLADLGRAIASARREASLTQVDLATIAGMGVSFLQSVEAGRRNVTARSLVRIATAIGVDLGSLFSRPPTREAPAPPTSRGGGAPRAGTKRRSPR